MDDILLLRSLSYSSQRHSLQDKRTMLLKKTKTKQKHENFDRFEKVRCEV